MGWPLATWLDLTTSEKSHWIEDNSQRDLILDSLEDALRKQDKLYLEQYVHLLLEKQR